MTLMRETRAAGIPDEYVYGFFFGWFEHLSARRGIPDDKVLCACIDEVDPVLWMPMIRRGWSGRRISQDQPEAVKTALRDAKGGRDDA